MVWVARPNDGQICDEIVPVPRSLADLKMSQDDLFATVLEGICPGCKRPLEIRDVNEMNNRYSDRCGWCELCLWGWSATIFRATEEDHVWRDGERLVTCYSQGALIEISHTPGDDFARAYLREWT